ncbi:MAG: hypothetical protein IPO30_20500 [Hyphomonadaceae bacterium]|nr:hypothetical protein [Hyphomonadaceae bacterium]
MARTPAGRQRPRRSMCSHRETRRKNIPTQENSSFMHPEDAAPVTLEYERRFSPASHPELYQRDKDLDPQLVWRGNNAGDGDVQLVWKGKDEEDTGPLKVDVVPIYIQEKSTPKRLSTIFAADRKALRTGNTSQTLQTCSLTSMAFLIPEDRLVYYDHDQVGLKWIKPHDPGRQPVRNRQPRRKGGCAAGFRRSIWIRLTASI